MMEENNNNTWFGELKQAVVQMDIDISINNVKQKKENLSGKRSKREDRTRHSETSSRRNEENKTAVPAWETMGKNALCGIL